MIHQKIVLAILLAASTNNVLAVKRLSLRGAVTLSLQSPTMGTLMLDLANTNTYDSDWVDFSSNAGELAAYKAISGQLVAGHDDLRSLYYSYITSAQAWGTKIAGGMPTAQAQVASVCNSTCFSTVLHQLSTENYYVQLLNNYYVQFQYLQNQLSADLQAGLLSAQSLVDLPSVAVPPPSGLPSWLSVILDFTSFIAGVSGGLGASNEVKNALGVAGAIATFVDKTVPSGGSSVSTNNIQFNENDMVNIEFTVILNSIQETYANLNSVASNQVQAICGNWGKLETFFTQVYSQDVTPSNEAIADFLNVTAVEMFQYQGYQWLFPSKYGICKENDYNLWTPKCVSDNLSTLSVSQGTTPEQECTNGLCGTSSCDVSTKVWICDLTLNGNVPPPALTNMIDSNQYATNTYFPGGQFVGQVENEGYSAGTAPYCFVAGMNFTMVDLGNCRTSEQYGDGDDDSVDTCTLL